MLKPLAALSLTMQKASINFNSALANLKVDRLREVCEEIQNDQEEQKDQGI